VSGEFPTREKSHGAEKRTSFGPIVTSAALTKYKVVRSEEGAEGPRADRIHGTRLKIDQDGTGNILIRGDFVIVDINSFELELVSSLVNTIAFDAMFVGHSLPELGTYENGSRDHEHGRRRVTAIAIAHRFDYHTVEVREISIKRRCAGSRGTA